MTPPLPEVGKINRPLDLPMRNRLEEQVRFDPMAGRAKTQVDRSAQTSELIARRTMHARAKVKPTAP
jgi:hypothetical protein